VPDAELSQRLADELTLAPPVDPPAEPRLIAPDAEVLEHRHLRDEPEVLVDEGETQQVRLAGVERERDGLVRDLERSAVVGRVIAGQDLDEGRLARAVLAEEAVHLAGPNVQIEIAQDGLPGKGLREVARGENGILARRAHVTWGPGGSLTPPPRLVRPTS
jgi:hypothetical protein